MDSDEARAGGRGPEEHMTKAWQEYGLGELEEGWVSRRRGSARHRVVRQRVRGGVSELSLQMRLTVREEKGEWYGAVREGAGDRVREDDRQSARV